MEICDIAIYSLDTHKTPANDFVTLAANHVQYAVEFGFPCKQEYEGEGGMQEMNMWIPAASLDASNMEI